MKKLFSVIFILLTCTVFPEERFVLITGCGRSGTDFMSFLLKSCGLQIEHERDGIDGCVSWPMAVNNFSPWGPLGEDVKFLHTFHQVRNPLHVITSWYINIQDLDCDEWVFIRAHIPEIKREDSHLVHCSKYWYYWNLLAERLCEWRYRIEDIDELPKEFESRLGVHIDKDILNWIPRNINTRNSTEHKVTWKDLEQELPCELFFDLQDMAKRYGYTTSD